MRPAAGTYGAGVQALLQAVEQHRCDVVAVHALDRLTRNVRDGLGLTEEVFGGNGVRFVSVTESFDTTTALGQAQLEISLVWAKLWQAMIAERTAAALRHKMERGDWQGSVPFG